MLNRILALFRREPPRQRASVFQEMRDALKPEKLARVPPVPLNPPPKIKKRN